MASSELIWHRKALVDAREAREWYAERSYMAARGFLLTLEDSVRSVQAAPERWPEHRHGCRRFVFPNQYPFSLVYRALSPDVVEIVAVAHDSRRPYYWKNR